MGAYRLGLRRRELFAVAFGIIIFLLIPLSVQTVLSATDPPVGTVWSITKTENAGTNGELNVMWSVKLDALSATQVTYRYTFTGEIGFITSQPCNNPNPVPLPFDRLAFKVFFSAGTTSGMPAPVDDESLLSSKPDYQAPSFVNCWNLANPPPPYPNAISYVRYQGLKFSTLATRPRTTYFSEGVGHSVTFTYTTNANPDGVAIIGGTIPVPSLSSTSASTTATSPKNSTTTSVPSSDSTTVSDSNVETTIPADTSDVIDTTLPVRNAEIPSLGEIVAKGEVAYAMDSETPTQEESRKENTAKSVVVTATVLISALSAIIPTMGSVGAAGIAGGLLGASGARLLSGPQLLPHMRPKISVDSSTSNSGVPTNRALDEDSPIENPSVANNQDSLGNPFSPPQKAKHVAGVDAGIDIATVGRLFTTLIICLQHVSRFRLFRPGLRRLAELVLVAPVVAVAIPIFVFIGSGILSIARYNGIIGPLITVVCLVLISIVAPLMSLLALLGWFVGRFILSPGTPVMAIAETIALIPGLLLIPMAMRTLIGPRHDTSKWEYGLSRVVAPIIALLAFRSWMLHLSDVTGSSLKILSKAGLPTEGSRILGVGPHADVWISAIVLSGATSVIANLALRYSDYEGRPILMLRKWVNMRDPLQNLRLEYVENLRVELQEPALWSRLLRIAIATAMIIAVLYEVLGWHSLSVTIVFFGGLRLVSKMSVPQTQREFHPIVRSAPMFLFGLGLGVVTLSSSQMAWGMTAISLVVICSTLVRTITLWDEPN